MSLNNKALRTGTAVVALALAAAACGGSSGGGKKTTGTSSGDHGLNASTTAGGQLVILNTADFEHLDPQRNYVGQALNFGRLLYRQLTTYKSVAGAAGSEIVPDLATNLGEPSNNAKTWTFHLKDGLKYEDGTPITSQDIKYGVERSMSPLIPDGPQYAKQYLVGAKDYAGPFEGKELDSIKTPDDKTIVFELNAPHGDFGYTVSLPTFAPVPKAKDTKVNYDARPFSSGPYKIQTYQRGKQMLLVRNTYWDKKTDPARSALPDTIKVVEGLDPAIVDQRLIASAGDDANAIQLDSSIQPESLARVINNPKLKDRSVNGYTGFLRYIAMNTQRGVTKNVKVRQAVEYAINKQDQQTARGGPFGAGSIASTIIMPNVAGYKKFNAYPAPDTGDVDKAKALLKEAGYPNGFTATLETVNKGKGLKQAVAFQAAMARVGIKINIAQVDQSVYYSTIGDIKKEPEFVIAAWGPDWPAPSTVIPPLFDGRQIVPQGNQNFSQLNEDSINKEMDRITSITNVNDANKAWGDLDEKIMTEFAPILPLLNDKAVYVVGSNVTNLYIHSFYGDPDLAALGVKK
ncbi:MAG: ABC transporter substrate-binding protein [Mycobacteriales bacterium]